MAKLMRTAFLIGLAATWRPDAAAGQYSWSDFSVSFGLGTRGAGLGIGASYTTLDPFYTVDPFHHVYFDDPCWDHFYYEWYWHACHGGYDRIHPLQTHSVVPVRPYRPRRPPWYYGPYAHSSYTHFALSFGVEIGYGFRAYGYPIYRYPVYRYAVYGYSGYGYPVYDYSAYGYPAYGVVRYGRSRTASTAVRPAPVYRGSPLVRSSPAYKESPRAGAQRATAASSITSGRASVTRPGADRNPRASRVLSTGARPTDDRRVSRAETPRGPSATATPSSPRVRPSNAASRATGRPRDGQLARRPAPTRLYPPSRATTRRLSASSMGASSNTVPQSAATAAGGEQPSRGPATERLGTRAPADAASRAAARSRSEAIVRSLSSRARAPATRSSPSAAARAPARAQPRTASPQRSRAIQPSARPAPARTAPRAPASTAAAPRATTSRARAPSGAASRGAVRTRATAPARGRSIGRARR